MTRQHGSAGNALSSAAGRGSLALLGAALQLLLADGHLIRTELGEHAPSSIAERQIRMTLGEPTHAEPMGERRLRTQLDEHAPVPTAERRIRTTLPSSD